MTVSNLFKTNWAFRRWYLMKPKNLRCSGGDYAQVLLSSLSFEKASRPRFIVQLSLDWFAGYSFNIHYALNRLECAGDLFEML